MAEANATKGRLKVLPPPNVGDEANGNQEELVQKLEALEARVDKLSGARGSAPKRRSRQQAVEESVEDEVNAVFD